MYKVTGWAENEINNQIRKKILAGTALIAIRDHKVRVGIYSFPLIHFPEEASIPKRQIPTPSIMEVQCNQLATQ